MTNTISFPQNPAPADFGFQNQFRSEIQSEGTLTQMLLVRGRRVLDVSAGSVLWQVEGYTCLFRARRDGSQWILERQGAGGSWHECDKAFAWVAFESGRPPSSPEPVPPVDTASNQPEFPPAPPKPMARPPKPKEPRPNPAPPNRSKTPPATPRLGPPACGTAGDLAVL